MFYDHSQETHTGNIFLAVLSNQEMMIFFFFLKTMSLQTEVKSWQPMFNENYLFWKNVTFLYFFILYSCATIM